MQERYVSLVSAGFLGGSVQMVYLNSALSSPLHRNSLLPPVSPQSEQFVLLPLTSHSAIQAGIPAVNMFYVLDVVVMGAPEFLSVYLWQTALLVYGILSL